MSDNDLLTAACREMVDVRNRQIAAVHQITRLLFSKLNLDERIRDALMVSMAAVDAAAGSIYLYRAGDDSLVFQYVVGPPASGQLVGKAISATEGIAGRVFQTGQAEVDNHPEQLTQHRRDIGEAIGFVTRNMVTVPLRYHEGDSVGVMQILNKESGDFNQADLEVLEIVAAVSATAIENAVLQRQAQTAAVARAVGDLSHDIKNKVAPIPMAVELLRPDMDTMFAEIDTTLPLIEDGHAAHIQRSTEIVRGEYREHFDIIMEQVFAVREHTKRIADVLKGTITEASLEMNDIAPIVQEQIRQLAPVARQRGVAIVTDVDGVPRCLLDQFFIRSAIYNLVSNAIPETPEGGRVTIRATAVQDGVFPRGQCLVVEVSDTGRGMSANMLDSILRGDAASTKIGGTGLGTKIVYNAVAAHKGRFEGESAEGQGTTFRMRLPLRFE